MSPTKAKPGVVKRLPRPFHLPWGEGMVTEEVSVPREHWEPTVQLLEYADGSKTLRFCYYHQGRFGRGPLIADAQDLRDLLRAAKGEAPGIYRMLKSLGKG